jgi:hypothetical protein
VGVSSGQADPRTDIGAYHKDTKRVRTEVSGVCLVLLVSWWFNIGFGGRIRWQSLVPPNQGFPGKIQEPDLPVAMWTSSFLFLIPNRSASALVHPKGTRSNV